MFDLQGEVFEIMEAVGDALDDLDLIVDSFELARVHPMPAVIDDSVAVALQGAGEAFQRRMAVLPGDAAPFGQRSFRPARDVVRPDVRQEILEPVDGVEPLIERENLV